MSDTLTDLRSECDSISRHGIEYDRRMMHRVPDAPVVGRLDYIVEQCRGKAILHCGCVGGGSPICLHEHVKHVASEVRGIDLVAADDPFVYRMDLDDVPRQMPGQNWGIELVLVPELLEHLTNPGRFLRSLHVYHCPILITVPNAFAVIGVQHMARGEENVHVEHVANNS